MSTVYGAVRFVASKAGKTGLTVAGMVDVYQITKSTGASSQVVTDGLAIEIGQGLYGYAYGSADTALYAYLAVFTTADTTVDDTQPAVWMADIAEQAALTVVDGNVDAILLDTGTDGVPLTAAAVDAILDEAVEGAYTLRQLLRIALAALAAKCSGGGTTTITFRDLNDTKNRIVATVDASGNRTAVTVTGT